jgi:hypothetical protein
LRCRFHAWCWNLDGSIKSVTDPHDFHPDAITPERLRLPQCRVDTWGGFVFVNMDEAAPPLLDYLAPIPDFFAPYQVEKMRLTRARSTVVPANWKVVIDAFNEGYHLVGVHPQMLQYLDDTRFRYAQYGMHSVFGPGPGAMGHPSPRLGDAVPDRTEMLLALVEDMAGESDVFTEAEVAVVGEIVSNGLEIPEGETLNSVLAGMRRVLAQSKGIDLWGLPDTDILEGMAWNIFPNVALPLNAASGYFFRSRPNGRDPGSCLFDIWTLQRVGEGEEPVVKREEYPRLEEHDWGRVLLQDFSTFGTVQRGMRSRRFEGSICGRPDSGIDNFHTHIREYIGWATS